eukprot:5315305-Pyramimonas_sp.AAC.1
MAVDLAAAIVQQQDAAATHHRARLEQHSVQRILLGQPERRGNIPATRTNHTRGGGIFRQHGPITRVEGEYSGDADQLRYRRGRTFFKRGTHGRLTISARASFGDLGKHSAKTCTSKRRIGECRCRCHRY